MATPRGPRGPGGPGEPGRRRSAAVRATPTIWSCPRCGAPFANANASHSCVSVDLAAHFVTAEGRVREAFDRLVDLASVDGPVTVVAQKTRIVLAAPMRFVAVQVRSDRLIGHVLAERPQPHPVVTAIVADAYESGLYLHSLAVRHPGELDEAFAAFLREAAERVGRQARLGRR